MTHSHRKSIRVVKLGGRTQAAPLLPSVLASAWQRAPGSLVVVHGGGDQISALQRLRGEEPQFIGGRRVTTDLALELVRMVLSGLANKQLVSVLTAAGAPAVGISGEDGAMLRATPIDPERFGHSGTPASTDVSVITALLSSGFLPVISPVATHVDREEGGALNVNGDDAAAAIAAALGAEELFLMVDVAGVLDQQGERIEQVTLDQVQSLVASGVAGGGMAAKLDACSHALHGGVARVRVGNLEALDDSGAGTAVVLDHVLPLRT